LIAVDASALARVLVEKGESGDAARRRLRGQALIAPSLVDAEVLSVLRGLCRSGKLPQARAQIALDLLASLPMQRAPLPPHLPRAWQLRHNYSAYDALYVAVAESADCPLLTCDSRLANGTGAHCPIDVIP
jgi:predicted nucleic acid-binding protein